MGQVLASRGNDGEVTLLSRVEQGSGQFGGEGVTGHPGNVGAMGLVVSDLIAGANADNQADEGGGEDEEEVVFDARRSIHSICSLLYRIIRQKKDVTNSIAEGIRYSR